MVPDRILDVARSWIGVPYRKAGRDRCRGIDCLNFTATCFFEAGVISELPPPRDYSYGFWKAPGDSILESIESALRKLRQGRRVEEFCPPDLPSLMPGDLLGLCQLRKLDKLTHTVLVESVASHSVTIIHAKQGRSAAVIRDRLDPSHKILKVYRAS